MNSQFLFLVSLIFLLLLFIISDSQGIQRVSYGESCTTKIRCSSQSWLTCRNGTCDCAQPNTMIYRQDVNKCVAKSGERCKFEIEGTNLVESADCVKNAECSANGVCTCANGYYEDLEQNCQREKSFDEPCNEIDKCASNSGLTCTNGKCACNSNSAEYSRSLQQCVGLIGKPCIKQKCADIGQCKNNICTCPENMFAQKEGLGMICSLKRNHGAACYNDDACIYSDELPLRCVSGRCECEPEKGRIYDLIHNKCVGKVNGVCYKQLCTENAYCRHNRCVCSSSYKTEIDRTCKKSHNADCTRSDQCAGNLECIKFSCQCKYPSIQNYKNGECLSKVEAPCVHNSTCESNAYCQRFQNSLMLGSCKCQEGFVEGKNRICKAAYGSFCIKNDKGEDPCDDLAGLQCINEKCGCPGGFSQKFNETSRVCVGLVGSMCSQVKCTENAECVTPRYNQLKGLNLHLDWERSDNRCQCKEGYIPDENYECVLGIKGENTMDELLLLLATEWSNSTEWPQADE